jgi:hypothetical protein
MCLRPHVLLVERLLANVSANKLRRNRIAHTGIVTFRLCLLGSLPHGVLQHEPVRPFVNEPISLGAAAGIVAAGGVTGDRCAVTQPP